METYCSQEITELAKALIAVQKYVTPATKDANNPFTKSNYATLNSVMRTCREALLENGIWLCQHPAPVEVPGCIGLVTKLTHAESGQWQSSLAVVPLPKADPQGMGGAITYARRYALTAMLGMVTEDDDGEAAKIDQKSTPRSRKPATASQTQKVPQGEKTAFGHNQNRGANGNSAALDFLPELEGIAYQVVAANDGRECVIATGNTHAKKEILQGAGFRWNPQRKVWWKYTDAA